MNRQELLDLLSKYAIPIETWGTGESKTLEHLVDEVVINKETVLETRDDGRLVRTIYGSTVDVRYRKNGREFRLKEACQVFADGRTRTRDLEGFSIGEKLAPGEDPFVGAKRALKEELGIVLPDAPLYLGILNKKPEESKSFPGLISVYILHKFGTMLTDDDFREEGYVEVQEDKTSYFVWVPYKKDQKAG